VLGLLNDPAAAAKAHAVGVGGQFAAALGGNSGLPGLVPFDGRFQVDALSDGRFPFSGVMYGGSFAELGPTAVLRVLDTDADIRVVVGSKRCQCLDQAIFTHIGIDPAEQRIIGVKSTVHSICVRIRCLQLSNRRLAEVHAIGIRPCRRCGGRLRVIVLNRPNRKSVVAPELLVLNEGLARALVDLEQALLQALNSLRVGDVVIVSEVPRTYRQFPVAVARHVGGH